MLELEHRELRHSEPSSGASRSPSDYGFGAHPPETISELVRVRAQLDPDAPFVTFLADGDRDARTRTYQELARRSRAVAGLLAHHGLRAGDRVLIMLPTGLEFVETFFGALLAGMVPVPVYPPARLSRLDHYLRTLASISHTAACRAAVLDERLAPLVKKNLSRASEVLISDREIRAAGGIGPTPPVDPEEVAFLQFTSGTTEQPRGVVLQQQNVMAQLRSYVAGTRPAPGEVAVSWLPLYHDLGLIGMVLATLYSRAHLVLLSPVDFLGDPFLWLRAIHRYRGVLVAAPNFAYDLCVRKCSHERLRAEAIDLGSLAIAGVGGEPVSLDTIERFRTHFAPFGLRPEVMSACYGLAENTLVATGHSRGEPLRSLEVSLRGLKRDVVEPPESPADGFTIVGNGRPFQGNEVRIVHEDGRVLPERRVGEIQVKGPSVAAGYFDDEAATRESFVGEDGDRWLRTGDVGFLDDGDLYVCDRKKDLIIVRGQNHYPSDLEATAGRVDGLRPGSVIALCLGAGSPGSERAVVVAERDPACSRAEDEIRNEVIAAVSRDHGLLLEDVIQLPKDSVPKTSSGKVQRGAMREALERDDLSVFAPPGRLTSTWIKLRVLLRIAALGVRHAPARWRSRVPPPAGDPGGSPLAGDPGGAPLAGRRPERASDGALLAELRQALPSERAERMARHLVTLILEIDPQASPDRIDAGRPLEELGIESMHVAELHETLRRVVGYDAPIAELYRFPTLNDIARHLVADTMGLDVGRLHETGSASVASREHTESGLGGLSDERVAELLSRELREMCAEPSPASRRDTE